MGKRMVAAARVLLLCAVVLALPAIAASQPTALSPGWYRNGGPAMIFQDNSGGIIGWMNSYLYQYPGNAPLYWYAQVIYLNTGNQTLPLTCVGRTDPSLAKAHLRGTPNAGTVAAEDTFCSRNPSFTGQATSTHPLRWWGMKPAHLFEHDSLVQRQQMVCPW